MWKTERDFDEDEFVELRDEQTGRLIASFRAKRRRHGRRVELQIEAPGLGIRVCSIDKTFLETNI